LITPLDKDLYKVWQEMSKAGKKPGLLSRSSLPFVSASMSNSLFNSVSTIAVPEPEDGRAPSEKTLKSPYDQNISPKGSLALSTFTLKSDSATFVRNRSHYVPAKQWALRNSLLAAVGYLELANAGDFPANVWNEVPVPTFVIVLLVLGGSLAISISYFAMKDARLSWSNLRLLREERHRLRPPSPGASEDGQVGGDTVVLSDVRFKEIGTEIVDRIFMELMMGIGALVVGVGTFLAIGGANQTVWYTSNLMSGYIGNSPAAVYGVVNAMWSVFLWTRAHRHSIAGKAALDADVNKRLLEPRIRIIKTHAVINGLTGFVAGVASLITARQWWGYVMLAPCIIASVWCNYIWRGKIGYERPFVQQPIRLSRASLVRELEFVSFVRQALQEASPSSDCLDRLLASESKSLASIIDFLVTNDLFEDFCMHLLQDKPLSTALFNVPDVEALTITSQDLLGAESHYIPRLLDIARACISDVGLRRFLYRERYLLETLGCYLCANKTVSSNSSSEDLSSEV
jgi:hypothetical protein